METFEYLILDAAMRSAYVALARRLAQAAGLDLLGLADDLEMLGSTQPEALWRDQHQSLAAVLRMMARMPAGGC